MCHMCFPTPSDRTHHHKHSLFSSSSDWTYNYKPKHSLPDQIHNHKPNHLSSSSNRTHSSLPDRTQKASLETSDGSRNFIQGVPQQA